MTLQQTRDTGGQISILKNIHNQMCNNVLPTFSSETKRLNELIATRSMI